MTDPFFTTGNTTQNMDVSHTPNTPKTPAEQIKILNNQQTQIQTKYKELKDLYSGEESQNLNITQKQQIQQQMQKLSDLYTRNKQAITALSTSITGEKEIYTNKDVAVVQQKKNKKFSFKGIMFGCIILFIFIVGGLAAVFYYLIQNPGQLGSVGINPQTATQLLQTFATIFFGLLFFASLGMLIINFYRLTTSKNTKKIGYIFGIILGFIILVGTLIGGAKVLNILKDIEISDFVDSNAMLNVYWENVLPQNIENTVKTEYQPRDSSRYPLIAPANIAYKINDIIFDKQILPQLGNVNVISAKLDCGNGQELDIGEGYKSIGACMYTQKGDYQLRLMLTYVNNETAEQLTKNMEAGILQISSQVKLNTNKGDVVFSKNEIIAGDNPIKITYDASSIFTDFQLPDYKIIRDVDGDGIADKSDLSIYTYLYTGAGKYYVKVKYPNLNDHLYVFPIRVEQSDVPVAQIHYTPIDETKYSISADFFDVNPDISEYVFNIIDKKNDKQIDSITSQTPNINYTFPGDGQYIIQLVFVTLEGKQGFSESDEIIIGDTQFQILYDIYAKTPTSSQFQKLDSIGDIQLKEIPTILKIDITNVIPSPPTLQKSILINGLPIVSTNDTFQLTIDSSKDYDIKIVADDPNHNMRTEKNIKVSVGRDDIVGNLLVSPSTVGISPFEVKFDASTTTIHDPQDEIVYFTRDFGDGETQTNLSQSIIYHTYNYNFESENGTFYPIVTITTKKGRKLVISSGTMILVKKQNISLDINIDSHPAQIANIGEKVDLSLDTDGFPKNIFRDFGNGNTLECKGRECISASQIYNMTGEYMISAKVTFSDKPTIEGNVNLVIK